MIIALATNINKNVTVILINVNMITFGTIVQCFTFSHVGQVPSTLSTNPIFSLIDCQRSIFVDIVFDHIPVFTRQFDARKYTHFVVIAFESSCP